MFKNKKQEIKLVEVEKYKVTLKLINGESETFITDWINTSKYIKGIIGYLRIKMLDNYININNKLIKSDKIIKIDYELYNVGILNYTILTNKEINYYCVYEDDYIIIHDL